MLVSINLSTYLSHIPLNCKIQRVKSMREKFSLFKRISFFSVEFMFLDLASFDSVRKFADDFCSKDWPLHILINNGECSKATFL